MKYVRKTLSKNFIYLAFLALTLMAMLFTSCNSATRVVTMSSDGSYSVRYIDSKTPVTIDIPPVDIHK